MNQDNLLTIEDVAEALHFLTLEIVAALSPNDRIADEKLEDIAGQLLQSTQQMQERPSRLVLYSLAKSLIQTERGAGL